MKVERARMVSEKPTGNARNLLVAADRETMLRSRATPAIAAGLVALVCAIAAVAADQIWLLIAAAMLALISALIVIDWHRQHVARRAARAELAVDAAQLLKESDEALSRAAKFEAEAIRARAELADAMTSRNRRAGDATTVRGPIAHPATRATDEPIVDGESGLFNQTFFEASLVKRVSAARRGLRPLTVAVADVVVNVGTPELERAAAEPVAATMTHVFREADTVARSGDGLYLILLEDTPENSAIWTLERLRRGMAEAHPGHTLWVGVSCYPAYGFDAEQLMGQARDALESAREWQQDRIEVTTASPD